MIKKQVVKPALIILMLVLSFFIAIPAYSAIETALLTDVSPSTGNVPYQKTQWYGFTAVAGKGYCAILAPLTGNSDLYLLDNNFTLRASSKNTGLTIDKIWYGQSVSGPLHIASYGALSPSSNYTVQVISAPYVTSISPASGNLTTLVTINGFGFGATRGTSYVKFGNIQATNYYSWTNTQIKVYVPSGAAGGTLSVAVYVAGVASNAKNFTLPVLASSDGTMWKYDLGRTGNYPNGPTIFPLNLKWSYTINDGSYYGDPVVVNNVVYISNGYGKLTAIDTSNGTLKWEYKSTGHFSAPAFANGIIYVNCSNGNFYALDANTGLVKWFYSTGQTAYLSYSCSPAIMNGIVYTNISNWNSSNSKCYAFNASTGVLKWSYSFATRLLHSPAIANNTVYLTPEGYLTVIALDVNTGVLKWSFSNIGDRASTPLISNGTLYVVGTIVNMNPATAKLVVYALDANNGTKKWNYASEQVNIHAFSPTMCSSPAISGNTLYFGGLYTELYALDVSTMTLKWKFSSGSGNGFVCSSPAISNNVVYVGSHQNAALYAFDASTGAVKWSSTIGIYPEIYSSFAVANGRIFIGKEALYCFGQ